MLRCQSCSELTKDFNLYVNKGQNMIVCKDCINKFDCENLLLSDYILDLIVNLIDIKKVLNILNLDFKGNLFFEENVMRIIL
jgi:hypothetical protein